jgi:hypothetical protein
MYTEHLYSLVFVLTDKNNKLCYTKMQLIPIKKREQGLPVPFFIYSNLFYYTPACFTINAAAGLYPISIAQTDHIRIPGVIA